MADPVFIVGMPRSGTTLVASILNASDELAITPETDYFPNHWRTCERGGCTLDPSRYRAYVRRVLESSEFSRLGMSEGEAEELIGKITAQPPSHGTLLNLVLGWYARRNGKARWGEKTPAHALFVPEILSLFPDARIVHVVRDPRDVLLSLQQVPWGERGNMVQRVRKWRQCLEIPERAGVTGGKYVRVLYEELLQTPEEEVRRLCGGAGITYTPSLLDFHSSTDLPFDGETEPWKRRAQQPLDPTNTRKWVRAMPSEDIAAVELLAREQLRRLGYPVTSKFSWPIAARVAKLWVHNLLILIRHSITRIQSYVRRRREHA